MKRYTQFKCTKCGCATLGADADNGEDMPEWVALWRNGANDYYCPEHADSEIKSSERPGSELPDDVAARWKAEVIALRPGNEAAAELLQWALVQLARFGTLNAALADIREKAVRDHEHAKKKERG